MASDETIRAALRAAEKAVADVFCGETHEDDKLIIVTAVGAFLRALPERFIVSLGPGENYNNLPSNQMHIVADAVVRAAKGER